MPWLLNGLGRSFDSGSGQCWDVEQDASESNYIHKNPVNPGFF
jgi:hypothetical protein